MKIKLAFLDWRVHGTTIYSASKTDELSRGHFHSGTTFDGTITLDREDEREFRKSILNGFQPCFWVSGCGDEIKPKGGKRSEVLVLDERQKRRAGDF